MSLDKVCELINIVWKLKAGSLDGLIINKFLVIYCKPRIARIIALRNAY